MPNYSPAKPGRCPWHLAAILHAMTNTVRSWTTMMMCLPPRTARSRKNWSEYFCQQGDPRGVLIANSLDEEARLLRGPTMKLTVSEEAVLLEEETPTVDMRQF